MLVSLIGGIGLFLLGMTLLTEGLKSFAGDSLRRALLRFTGRPVTAFVSGALVTAMVQSSSATTLTTIGFVSAGLLSFAQSIGVVMGASLGTTSTGWLVAVFGLKFSISVLALPVIGIGAFMRMLAKGRLSSLGLALAGFGLIFVGIDYLQMGMAGLTEHVDLEAIPSTGLFGHLLMMLVGIILTVIMQSSSAAVATTLTALHADAISFEQAASLVIGAAIGTTVTAAIAAIGASTAAKRTALAHVLFNLFTGLVAVILLPLFLWALTWAQEHVGLDRGAVSLAAFHTAFIALGVLIGLPFIKPFSRLIERMLPERGPRLTRHLDTSLLTIPSVAMETARGALRETAGLMFNTLQRRLQSPLSGRAEGELIGEMERALAEISEFIGKIPSPEHSRNSSNRRSDSFHAIDHLSQLLPSISQRHLPVDAEPLAGAAEQCRTVLQASAAYLSEKQEVSEDLPKELEETSKGLAQWRKEERLKILEASAAGGIAPDHSLRLLDTIRWIDQIVYHTWRITFYLKQIE